MTKMKPETLLVPHEVKPDISVKGACYWLSASGGHHISLEDYNKLRAAQPKLTDELAFRLQIEWEMLNLIDDAMKKGDWCCPELEEWINEMRNETNIHQQRIDYYSLETKARAEGYTQGKKEAFKQADLWANHLCNKEGCRAYMMEQIKEAQKHTEGKA